MIKKIDSIGLFSENAKKLKDFYVEKVGLKVSMEGEMGENNDVLYGFDIGEKENFFIMSHSEVKGKNKNPERYLINFEVDDIDKEVEKLKSNDVKQIQEKYHVEGYGYISTFEDSDGNYFQLVQVREN
ncbi:MAG TPA: VOC family protein [Patescibacteria group bacterium]|nr:VOC family protein [Patescibacteria group bacterium]